MSSVSTCVLLLCLFGCITDTKAVRCYSDYASNKTCEGDFCVAFRSGSENRPPTYKTCISGAKKPSAPCFLAYSEEMTCFCDTDLCNTELLFRSNFTVLPIIECKSVRLREYIAAACNKCVRRIEYFKTLGEGSFNSEHVECNWGTSFEFILDPNTVGQDRITKNFYSDACYNVSLHAEYYLVYCRCSQANCNTPEATTLPYPISTEPQVTCFTSGWDDTYDREKYMREDVDYLELVKNESYVDEGTCRGHYCFVGVMESSMGNLYYKGCISANEQGENKIQLGYSYLNYVAYYICDTDFCNADTRTALEEASNTTRFHKDNTAATFPLYSLFFVVLLKTRYL